MQNELYLGPSTDVSKANQLGSAALDMVYGAANAGHERRININDHDALLVAYILLNGESVGLFIHDKDDGSHVHHRYMSSRVERCLLAHAAELASPFIPTARPEQSMGYLPDLLLASTLASLTASQRLYRKIRAIQSSPTPVFATRAHLSEDVIIVRVPEAVNTQDYRAQIEVSDYFISWLSNTSDEHIARVVDGCELSDRPNPLKTYFATPELVSSSRLSVLDGFDAYASDVAAAYAVHSKIEFNVAHQHVTSEALRHVIDRGLVHGQTAEAVARVI